MKEREMLADHGTQIVKLTPGSVLGAARADMKRKIANAEIGKQPFGYSGYGYEHYAFHRRHVRRAVDAADLLARASNEPEAGLTSKKYNTRLLYSDVQLIRAAIELARVEAGGADVGGS